MTSTIAQPTAGLPYSTYRYKESDIRVAEQQSSILSISINMLKAQEFRYYLVKRMPLVITGVNAELQLPWSPLQLMRDYGAESCSVEDCEKQAPASKQTLSHFLKYFCDDGAFCDNTPVWKVKVCLVAFPSHLFQFQY